MAMEIPDLNEYFENILEVRDARFRDQCTMECEFCDCTRNIRLPGKPLMDELNMMTSRPYDDIRSTNFIDVGKNIIMTPLLAPVSPVSNMKLSHDFVN